MAEVSLKDWTCNDVAVNKTNGFANNSIQIRHNEDYYATEPKAVRLLLELEKFEGDIWECSCGEGHLSEEIKKFGFNVYSSDLINRGYGVVKDFLSIENFNQTNMNIITNPPYKYANEFVIKAMTILKEGKKLALFLPIRYLEGKARKRIYKEFPPKTIYVSSSRLICAINGNFHLQTGSAVSYAWLVWQKGYKGETILKWFN